MREEHLCVNYFLPDDRITPACAGRTGPRLLWKDRERDHPRVCGKNQSVFIAIPPCSGSPPRVREEPDISSPIHIYTGITPACAGRTKAVAQGRPRFKDHPRVCGKNETSRIGSRKAEGSPPRVREELEDKYHADAVFRITPACAGRTRSRIYPRTTIQDHPRVCGKNAVLPYRCI